LSNIDIRKYATDLSDSANFQEMLRLVKADIIKEWANTETPDGAKRENLYFELQAIGRFETKLKSLVDDKVISERKAAAERLRTAGPKTAQDTW
jgi:hypothetical protein